MKINCELILLYLNMIYNISFYFVNKTMSYIDSTCLLMCVEGKIEMLNNTEFMDL